MGFMYWDAELPYFYALYNLSHLNERQIELAIARWWLGEHPARPLLEFGNVMSHYRRCRHTVVDRYEQPAWYQHLTGQKVHNVDVLDHTGRYATIVSISTLEHVGMERDATLTDRHPGALAALGHLHGLLTPGGAMLITFPTGVNPVLDGWVLGARAGVLPELGLGPAPTRICTIGRGEDDTWVQDSTLTLRPYGAASNHPRTGEWAEGIVVAEFNR